MALYSLVYSLLKLAYSSLLVWLPFYISDVLGQEGNKGSLAMIYDLGTVVGTFVLGFISDRLGMRSPVVIAMLLVSAPCLYAFSLTSASLLWPYFILAPILGFQLGGISGLVASAVAADLGKQDIGERKEALATVAGIVDGTGSLGTALGAFIVGWLLQSSWSYVFYFLIGSD